MLFSPLYDWLWHSWYGCRICGKVCFVSALPGGVGELNLGPSSGAAIELHTWKEPHVSFLPLPSLSLRLRSRQREWFLHIAGSSILLTVPRPQLQNALVRITRWWAVLVYCFASLQINVFDWPEKTGSIPHQTVNWQGQIMKRVVSLQQKFCFSSITSQLNGFAFAV